MKNSIVIQRTTKTSGQPSDHQARAWARQALAVRPKQCVALTLRFVGRREGAALNWKWRGKQGPTNVLSFPAGEPRVPGPALLGDIVLCAPVISREALQQGKSARAHWAHLIVHGILHLLGYDHQQPAAARRMETLEKKLLAGMGIADPYQ